jgi:transposase-like protein
MKLDITRPIYNDEDAARAHLEAQLWPNGPHCPHCGSFNATGMWGTAHRKGLYQCNEPECRLQFSVTVGTVFERSKIPLHKWVLASHLFAASKKGMSSKQMERMLGVTYKTAWFMTMRLREASRDKYSTPIGGKGKIVESDETFVGGKKKNVHKGKPTPKKKPVHALVERGGEARVKHVADVTAKTLRGNLRTLARRESELHTDEALAYHWMGRKEFAKHKAVNHSQDEYYRYEDGAGTQSAESFFAILKRGVYGTFHSISAQHLQRYCDEFAFRWNTRSALGIEDFERANELVRGAKGKRLTYRRPDASPHEEAAGA